MATLTIDDDKLWSARIDDLAARVRVGVSLNDAQSSALSELVVIAKECGGSASETRPSAAARVACDLPSIVRDAARPLLAQAKAANVTIDAHMRPNVEIVVDRVKMTWVVASLLGNALRYSPRHAEILVLVSTTRTHAEIRVVDHGPGISTHLQARLFDGQGGRGLTLVLIGEIVEAHGGTIAVRSDLGGGTTFVLTLPATPGPIDHDEDERAWTLDPTSSDATP